MVREARMIGHHVWFNTLAGSGLTPRFIRWLMYNLGGADVETTRLFAGATIVGTDLHIGDRTFLNRRVYLDAGKGHVEVGEGCLFGPEVMVLTSTHDVLPDGYSSPYGADVTIGDRVWLGARAMILPGVTVGDGCVIAAGAVVTRDCAPGGLYAGAPARRIRDLHAPAACAAETAAASTA
jgi:acetyltransferase-like isoleucine patch superfamily enzyme